jgi:voltage-gated potassium channel
MSFFKLLKNIGIAFLVLAAITLIGTFGYWTLSGEKASLLDCFYMTVITITTIGYGEVVDVSRAPYGRLFTIFIAISGVGTFTYMLTNFTAIIVNGEFFNSLRQTWTIFKAKKMEDHYIVCGSGEIGFQIVEDLIRTERKVVIIDKSNNEINRYGEQKISYIIGDATDEDILLQAGIHNAAGLFAVTGDDNHNLVVTFTARQMNPELRIIAKSKDTLHIDKIRKAGADSVISPYLVGGLRMVSEMVRPAVVSFLDEMLRDRQKNFRIEEINLAPNFVGKKLGDISAEKIKDAVLLSVRSGEEWVYVPDKNTVLDKDSVLIFLTTPEARRELEQRFSD